MHTIYIQAKQKNKTKQKESHNYLKSLTQEVTMHIRNAQGGPLISAFFRVVSGHISEMHKEVHLFLYLVWFPVLIAISLSH